MHLAVTGDRPGEAATLQPFGQQAQSVAGGPQQFDLTAAAAPEDEDVAGHRVIFQRCLHLCGETIEAVAHIGDTGNQPDFCACGKIYHTDPRISSRRTVLISSTEGEVSVISPPRHFMWQAVVGEQDGGSNAGREGSA